MLRCYLTFIISTLIFAKICQSSISYEKYYYNTTIERGHVPKMYRSWSIDFPGYKPVAYTAECPKNVTCDPDIEDPNFEPRFNDYDNNVDRRRLKKHINGKHKSYALNGKYPLNPNGRTGVTGRGVLRRYGPNYLVQILISRGQSVREYIVVEPENPDGLVSFPEDFVDSTEFAFIPPKLYDLLLKELSKFYDPRHATYLLEKTFKNKVELYRGFVADNRNTDNAWIEALTIEYNDPKYKGIGKIKLNPDTNPMHLKWQILDLKFFVDSINKVLSKSDMSRASKIVRAVRVFFDNLKAGSPGHIYTGLRVILSLTSLGLGVASIAG
ncbi:ADP-ribose pyrophosphatase, mitochondrial [Trichinella nativa]|uniref:ADP-ribose pyrophosphatase, mitochondrial n=3 Tax=Trichinella TaxID=6333 RepID=A0A0V1KSL7_9BILA|nr:ADP-ribose pyrophosphatase, mitochondrial [Trichinella murrelli]KRX65276.1 ADP-ribose pyrophosphatase, mitochondrial [Trichinella sp. T9]KRX74775.1 ADP-ribose pyrophosphatase, mitochondrial [Trichinella sp. T6]KRY49533.1 ADP-ribose pyrophosphatase, mitochondrial [Trichinella britovi]KRZ50355.1 ADP-ribose pyrophosphatase, mitochondrial [Trichinella nativa]KRZ86545.1 ADP-ribose pyrophosphatase, mitochondrial [Trichinella sp. T8]